MGLSEIATVVKGDVEEASFERGCGPNRASGAISADTALQRIDLNPRE